MTTLLSETELEAHLRDIGARRYHRSHPFHHMLHGGRCSKGQVQAWALNGDFDPVKLKSNYFSMEWPPGSGREQQFPEVDRAEWFDAAEARSKINPAQWPLWENLQRIMAQS